MSEPVPELHHLVRTAMRLRLDLDVLLSSATHGRLGPDLVRALAPAVLAVMGYQEALQHAAPSDGAPTLQTG